MKVVIAMLAGLLAVAPAGAWAGGHGGGHGASSRPSSRSTPRSGHTAGGSHASDSHQAGSRKATGVERNARGKIKRDREQRAKFMRTHPCPSTGKTHGACPGYVVDHVHALKHGGRDEPANMAWQTKEAARAKDRSE